MRIYLDTCSLQRPWDAKTDSRIHLEAEAILVVLTWCDEGEITLIASEVLQFEIERIQDPLRSELAYAALSKCTTYVDMTETVVQRADSLRSRGIQPLDALHLSSAIEAEAEYFCTCDDKFLRRAKALMMENPKVVAPLELVVELGL
jgi:predicted nucleic acid-binding protein